MIDPALLFDTSSFRAYAVGIFGAGSLASTMAFSASSGFGASLASSFAAAEALSEAAASAGSAFAASAEGAPAVAAASLPPATGAAGAADASPGSASSFGLAVLAVPASTSPESVSSGRFLLSVNPPALPDAAAAQTRKHARRERDNKSRRQTSG